MATRGRPPLLADKPRRAQQSKWATSPYGMPTARLLFASNWWFNEAAEEMKKPVPERDRKMLVEAFNKGCEFAIAAAPYLERRLASITHQTIPYDLSKLTDDELEQFGNILRRAGAIVGDSLADGEAATQH